MKKCKIIKVKFIKPKKNNEDTCIIIDLFKGNQRA